MIRPSCDDECPSSHPTLAALIGAVGAVLAAAIGPWLAVQRERERERYALERRLSRLERDSADEESDDE